MCGKLPDPTQKQNTRWKRPSILTPRVFFFKYIQLSTAAEVLESASLNDLGHDFKDVYFGMLLHQTL